MYEVIQREAIIIQENRVPFIGEIFRQRKLMEVKKVGVLQGLGLQMVRHFFLVFVCLFV